MPKAFSTIKTALALGLGVAASASALAQEPTRLLRFADIHEDKVTFVYAGDIYIADINSGQSTRLTSHEGFETFPKFSRDGKKIAFAGEYDGSRQVYTMNLDGSGLKQITYYNDVGPMPPRGGYDYRVMDWSADNKHVLVRGNRLPWGERMGRPYLVPVDGGLAEPLAVPETGGGMFSPDGKKYVYTPIDREFRTWKRYRGGRAQDVWIYNLENNTSEQLTTFKGTDNQPVWVGDKIYFLSDRDYTLNLYQYQKGGSPKKLTNHTTHDSLWASAGPSAIVYENDGFLYRFDPKTEKSSKLPITVEGQAGALVSQYKSVAGQIESMDISNDGQRAVFGARGEIFTVPASKGVIRNISKTPTAREISVSWSPNGKQIAYLSDASGEYDVYIRSQDGSGGATRLTDDGTIWRFAPVWSPDSKKLIFSDKNQTLWLLNVDSKRLSKLDSSDTNDITDYRWSPDSQWVVYTKQEASGYGSIWLANTDSRKARQLTSEKTSEQSPVFSADGNYLFFLSNRDYNLSFSSFEFNYLYNNATRVYAAQLTDDVPQLLPYKSDEVGQKSDAKKDKQDRSKDVKVDFAGFDARVIALPGNAGDYRNLQANGHQVFFIDGSNNGSTLKVFDINSQDDFKAVAESVSDYVLSANGEKALVRSGSNYAIVDAKPGQKVADNKLNLTHLAMNINPKAEWQQMYVDGWRILRDWFYDPNTHGMDWKQVREKYQPWVDAATHRTDLDYVFSEIAGELNAGHVYVNAGDQPRAERRQHGLLGAEFSKDKSGYFKVEKVFMGENWDDNFRSPFTEPGVNVNAGDYIVSINGVSTKSVNNIFELLQDTQNRTLEIEVNDRARTSGARTVFVKPIASETNLRYLNWVESRAKMVERLSGGRIGYLHLPNTAIEGNRELHKRFLPQITKDALIIDDRYNGGGFIPDRMIEILSRKTLNYWKFRGLKPNATPLIAHDGPKAMLINGYSSSGGDALPFYFRKLGLGKLIGTRTWGGLIGISGNPGLADGGLLLAATFRVMDADGNWVVENEGVSPDIEVLDRPELIHAGSDPSLERAVKELLKDLDENPRKSIKAPTPPSKF
ncbi:S41 family peptidase [Pleionea litopenaei]|uniref:Tricorn protease homolog n=1 Tax=Pleionea litopenaei TaxID=3070815 RepID=A0AA51RWN1_9GAMM|nr:PDZ domain-containing protein [Pleionea sp. HL-JVS1]WMS88829.1 PDZ domain-containing protein [Pleionea sp. HL-JVS1]